MHEPCAAASSSPLAQTPAIDGVIGRLRRALHDAGLLFAIRYAPVPWGKRAG